ncbi:MAG: hypothetical protein ACREA9_21345 [Pyrinomonadaceae bacterium]
MTSVGKPISTPERLAYWYFRLNGFLTTENFIVHPDTGRNQRTDADLLAVRFKHRAENLQRPMEDDSRIAVCDSFANVIIAEVKTGQCALNGPWTKPEEQNMNRVLKSIGCVPDDAVDGATKSLYTRGKWCGPEAIIRLFALGETTCPNLPITIEQQITWDQVINFVVERFIDYQHEKSSVGQWARDGLELRRLSLQGNPSPKIRDRFGLRRVSEEPKEPRDD